MCEQYNFLSRNLLQKVASTGATVDLKWYIGKIPWGGGTIPWGETDEVTLFQVQVDRAFV